MSYKEVIIALILLWLMILTIVAFIHHYDSNR